MKKMKYTVRRKNIEAIENFWVIKNVLFNALDLELIPSNSFWNENRKINVRQLVGLKITYRMVFDRIINLKTKSLIN